MMAVTTATATVTVNPATTFKRSGRRGGIVVLPKARKGFSDGGACAGDLSAALGALTVVRPQVTAVLVQQRARTTGWTHPQHHPPPKQPTTTTSSIIPNATTTIGFLLTGSSLLMLLLLLDLVSCRSLLPGRGVRLDLGHRRKSSLFTAELATSTTTATDNPTSTSISTAARVLIKRITLPAAALHPRHPQSLPTRRATGTSHQSLLEAPRMQ
jgi:hypothetical protein